MRFIDVGRDGFIESWHGGSAVLLDPTGAVDRSVGTIDATLLPRSSLKPLQAVAMVECGFTGREAALALAAASHDGEDMHLTGARATLAAVGLDESALQCPPELPAGPAALASWLRAGRGPARICHNCSGKHAAMVSTCVSAGWPIESYRAPEHPLQRAARSRIESLCGEPVAAVLVDGCGAPAFGVTLRGLARSFAALASASDGAAELVSSAMRSHPALIGGTGRAVSELTAAVPGLLCKEGAESVWAAALPDGRAFAAKIDDGSMRALPPLLTAVLRYWDVDGADAEVLERWSSIPVLGGGAPVGALTWSAELRDWLQL